MENPVKEVKKAFPTGKFILSTILSFIILNLILDALANFVPGVGAQIASFIARPFTFIKNKVSPAAGS